MVDRLPTRRVDLLPGAARRTNRGGGHPPQPGDRLPFADPSTVDQGSPGPEPRPFAAVGPRGYTSPPSFGDNRGGPGALDVLDHLIGGLV